MVRADEIHDIADATQVGEKTVTKGDGTVEVHEADMIEHRKLRISTRQWYAERLLPKVYGNKQQIEHSGAVGVVLAGKNDDELIQELMALVDTGRIKLPKGVDLMEIEDEPEGDEPEAAEDDEHDYA